MRSHESTVNATANARTRQRKPRVKPARTIRLVVPPNAEGRNAVVRIAVGQDAADYLLDRLPSDFGTAFRLQKAGEDVFYNVCLSDGGNLCDCQGHARWQHCKHADGLAALVQAGKL
jgi:hypothetical protein